MVKHGRIKGPASAGVTVGKRAAYQPAAYQAPAYQPRARSEYGSVKSAVAHLIDEAGGVKQVAHRLGVSEALVGFYANPGNEKEISFARVAALSGPQVTAGAEYLAHLCGGVFIPLPGAGGCINHLTAKAAHEFGDAVASIVTAMADGRMSAREAIGTLEEIDQLMHALAGLRGEVAALADAKP